MVGLTWQGTHLLNRRFGFVTPTPTAPAFPTLPSSLSVFSRMTSPSSSRPYPLDGVRRVPLARLVEDDDVEGECPMLEFERSIVPADRVVDATVL